MTSAVNLQFLENGKPLSIPHRARRCCFADMSASSKGGELFIVGNNDAAWKGLRYLQDWTEIASAFDIANTYLKKIQARLGVSPILRCWVELN